MTKTTNKTNKIRTARGAIMADKKICDLTYGKITIESKFDKEKNQRYISKSEVNLSAWAEVLGITRQTLSTRLKYLIKVGLVQENKEYYIMPIATEHFFDIEEKTFKQLVASAHKNLIRVYVCLLGWHRHCQKQGTKYQFSIDSLNRELKLTVNTDNREKTSLIIDTLERLGLIVVSDYKVKVGKGERFELLEAYDSLPKKENVIIRRETPQETPQETTEKKSAAKAQDDGFKF